MSDAPQAPDADATDARPALAPPPLPTLPSPTVTARLLAALPPGPTRAAARDALSTFTTALACRWAEQGLAIERTAAREQLESSAVHVFRMLDSGWRFADEPQAMLDMRRQLVADGVGHQLHQPWPAALAWLRGLAEALDKNVVDNTGRGRHMTWILDRFSEDVDTAARASSPLPDGRDTAIIAAGRALESALLDALEAVASAGGDLDRLVSAVTSDDRAVSHPGRPVEPAAGPPDRPPRPSAGVEVEEAPDE